MDLVLGCVWEATVGATTLVNLPLLGEWSPSRSPRIVLPFTYCTVLCWSVLSCVGLSCPPVLSCVGRCPVLVGPQPSLHIGIARLNGWAWALNANRHIGNLHGWAWALNAILCMASAPRWLQKFRRVFPVWGTQHKQKVLCLHGMICLCKKKKRKENLMVSTHQKKLRVKTKSSIRRGSHSVS